MIFRSAFSAEKEAEKIAVARAKTTVENILDAVGATEYELWISDKKENNFRYTIAPSYKANRTKPLPIHYGAVRKYLEKEWGAQVTPGQEADDALGIAQMWGISVADSQSHKLEDAGSNPAPASTIICSIDKDLKQIPGKHYNWVKDEFDEITAQQGIAFFYQQLLTGDRTDNIASGLYRMGEGKAQSLLAYCESEHEMLGAVRNQYQDEVRLITNGRLLWIRKQDLEIWSPPY